MSKTNATTKHASVRRRSRQQLLKMLAAAGLFLGSGFLQSCEKDILEGQPEWLGNSIYERLQEGIETNDGQVRSFNTTLRLIQDLGYEETLGRTGSKTLFVTPDDVYSKWFAEKGISYEQMTMAQKKQMFHNSMINNAYLIGLMSNVSGNPPEEGNCMRRETANTVYDSIPTINVSDMPVNPMGNFSKDVWAEFREEGKGIRVCKDESTAPMIHFLPAFMEKNNITAEDLTIISNGESNTTTDSWISGKKVISKEQTCKNGYIYVIDGVIESASNMAQAIHDQPNTKMWAQAIDRYSCPVRITGNTLKNFQDAYNTQDNLYSLRYFTGYNKNNVRAPFLKGGSLEDELNARGTLRFDPGWNQYQVPTSTQTMAHDAAMMIVPTDEAIKEWLENGAGKDINERFGSWENIDYETLATLINVNMLESFVSSVPSKFSAVLDNTSQRELGIKKEHIVKCIMCCNGVVYIVNQVYSPDSYDSVIYPAELQTHGTYSVINHALTGYYSTYSSANDFSPYLSSMESRFALIIPYNTTTSKAATVQAKSKVFRIIDPCSYGLPTQRIIEFFYSEDKVQGISYEFDPNAAEIIPQTVTNLPERVVQNRLYDLIDNNIIVGDIVDGQRFYKSKTGSILEAYKKNGQQYINGGYQIEKGEELLFPDSCIVHKGNGVTYGAACADVAGDKIVAVPMTATKSVYQILQEEKSDTLFYHLLSASDLLSTKEGANEPAGSDNKNINIFDSYNYTVYVPEDAKIKDLIDKGYLPTWEDYDALADAEDAGNADAKKMREVIKNRINNFLRYHIQDNSVLIHGENVSQSYETGKLNPKNNRFFTLNVTANASSLTVVDNIGNKCNVVKDGNLYNKLAREYWISNKGKANAELTSSSHAVIHKIDGVLLFDKSQLTSWRDEARK
ncbi:MAG: hypothetical protein MJZ29_07965 [Bacteroidaceae bacterium]|nr:hypothetical protein [Bacteroidaceae bacterium]